MIYDFIELFIYFILFISSIVILLFKYNIKKLIHKRKRFSDFKTGAIFVLLNTYKTFLLNFFIKKNLNIIKKFCMIKKSYVCNSCVI